ncbi:hypothetical protein H4P12_13540 [Paracoccus sp. 11-3]|uniref:Uncharacterized protein n=1 Tax=Paracoccus amoyensis TaxID=2760093 RepID=A0A926GCX0_9RHOB|nr:hypothetical protein [Paracoccus amoyensis]MBC9247701.1 hypothetical protein [Paracoccus amoyensis]
MTLLRVFAWAIVLGTAFLMVVGSYPPEFLIADAIAVFLLIVAALIPREDWALPALLSGFAFSLGVFVVAFGARAVGGDLGLPLLLGVLISTVAAGMAILRCARMLTQAAGRAAF